ncbi:nucleoid-associated protein [Nitratidesulfovibrio sp. SRB-5]|uniref:nucleoid-associated protein n=1 Tax=Nitratidesulfovibrio sp. SRB-5 TaxID=2872636 RepID=UPI0010258307|nr:nucleoid-associated protein [Nitratidesulfovibrio sp. SRB-5]MBZ2172061.1 nucleoid-associated protein [Nitratidesulfovibrio sp. SRB-5]RXF77568.1 hypothetical protein EKK70_06195 [Desulfovibrio sp. DS-1]
MIDISSARVGRFVVHHVGNKLREEGYILSSKESAAQADLCELLLKHYLLPLSQQTDFFEFFHESDLGLNELYRYSSNVFKDNESFFEQSCNIARHLYSVSTHPNVSEGELIIILFLGIRLGELAMDGLAILKMENKDSYLDVVDEFGTIQLMTKYGISLNKIQKGCLVFSSGNSVVAIDNLSKKTKYWNDSFLKIRPQRTMDACAKAGGTILKSIAAKVQDGSERISLNKKIKDEISSNHSLSLGELIDISKGFVSERAISGIVEGVRGGVGFDLSDGLQIDSGALLPYVRKMASKICIAKGVNIVVSDHLVSISDVSIEPRVGGFRAIIDMKVEEGE